MTEHFYSKEAGIDLLEIWEYIARDDIDAADRVVGEIKGAVLMLAQNPQNSSVETCALKT